MRAVLTRVAEAKVEIEGKLRAEIGKGVLILVGAEDGDTDADIKYIVDKCVNLRIFEDEAGKMNLSVADVDGALLVVSQFTLLGDARHGRRPGFTRAGAPDWAKQMYDKAIDAFCGTGRPVETGVFGADMQVYSVNDGPVTILLDSRKTF